MISSPVGFGAGADVRGGAAAGFGVAELALGDAGVAEELGRVAAATLPLASAATEEVEATSLHPAPARPTRSASGATLKIARW